MIVLVHNNNEPVALYDVNNSNAIDFDVEKKMGSILYELAEKFQNRLLIWVHQDYKEYINVNAINSIFHHKLIMTSYAVSGKYIIPEQIGYVEQKPYTNVTKSVCFPTWLMSSDIGGIYGKALVNIKVQNIQEDNFDFLLCSIAKQAMSKGLFCYSNPNLLISKNKLVSKEPKTSMFLLFKFVKQHYKVVWILNLFVCFMFFEKRLQLKSFFSTLFLKRLHFKIDLSHIHVSSNKEQIIKREADVIIPTLGRKDCLYNVLKDLSNQTLLPKNVIIVEQNPNENSVSELDYVISETWPFNIKHHFIHQIGVCNARNLALLDVTSDWVLLGDDDNRFESDLIEKFFKRIQDFGCTVLSSVYIQPHEKSKHFFVSQTDVFGSGNSFLKSSLLNKTKFDTAFEFGYGEDSDFGMQLRKAGNDVIFFPDIKITHLKAPIGGFRKKVKQLWDDEKVQPKPSPTIMLFVQKHYNVFQTRGYKYNIIVKFYKKQNIKNPFKYINVMRSQWDQSIFWSERLKTK